MKSVRQIFRPNFLLIGLLLTLVSCAQNVPSGQSEGSGENGNPQYVDYHPGDLVVDGGGVTPSPSPSPSGTPQEPTNFPPDPGTGPGGEAQMLIRDLDGQSGPIPVTVSHVFRKGHYTVGQLGVMIVERGAALPVQVDVLRRHAGGTIRHALISFILDVQPGETYTIRFTHGAPVAPPAFALAYNPNNLNPSLNLGSGNPSTSVSLRQIVPDPSQCVASGGIAGDRAYWRIFGPIYRECVIWAKLRKGDGTGDAQLTASFRVKTYTNWNGADIETVVENTNSKLSSSDTTSQFINRHFTAQLSSPGAATWTSAPMTLYTGTRFAKQISFASPIPNPEKTWDGNYLTKTRALDNLNIGHSLNDGNGHAIGYNYVNSIYRAGRPLCPEPGQPAVYVRSEMGEVGDRDDIGTMTKWSKVHLATMNRDALLLNECIERSELASNYEIHYRKSASSTTQDPGGQVGLECGGSTTDAPYPFATSSFANSQWVNQIPGVASGDGDHAHDPNTGAPGHADNMHPPRTGFMNYIFTGDLFYLEEMQFWQSYIVSGTYPFHCHVHGPSRAVAWAIRLATDTAWISPDTDPQAAYYTAMMQNQLGFYASTSSAHGNTRFPKLMDGADVSYELTLPGAPAWVKSERWMPWQNSWVCWSAQLMARRGYGATANAIRDWLCTVPMDLYTVETDASQAYTDPAGHVWHYNAYDSQAYYAAADYAPSMHACNAIYPTNPNDTTDPSNFIIGGFTGQFSTYGEMWYMTMLNWVHSGYPQPDWCPADGHDWTPLNGDVTGTPTTYNWHGYTGNSAATAIAEAVLDTNPETRSTGLPAARALQAYDKNHQYWTPGGFDLIASDPN